MASLLSGMVLDTHDNENEQALNPGVEQHLTEAEQMRSESLQKLGLRGVLVDGEFGIGQRMSSADYPETYEPEANATLASAAVDQNANDQLSQREAFWPNVRRFLTSPERWDELQVSCCICTENLSFCGRANQAGRFPLPDEDLEDGKHHAVVLPCGHIFGYQCLLDLLKSQEEAGGLPACCFCAASLQFRVCTHNIKPISAPGSAEDLKKFPPTEPEGAFIPYSCDQCRFRDWAHSTVDCLSHTVGMHLDYEGSNREMRSWSDLDLKTWKERQKAVAKIRRQERAPSDFDPAEDEGGEVLATARQVFAKFAISYLLERGKRAWGNGSCLDSQDPSDWVPDLAFVPRVRVWKMPLRILNTLLEDLDAEEKRRLAIDN